MKYNAVNKRNTVLFSLRLFLYFSVTFLVLLHPGIAIPYDRTGIILWFFIIPLTALIAFLPAPQTQEKFKFILGFIVLLVLSVIAGGFTSGLIKPFFAGIISFTASLLLFKYPRWAKISFLEPFFLTWVCLRLLAFSRSGEDTAGESMGLTQFILVWTALVFVAHNGVIYFCLFNKSAVNLKKEIAVLGFFFTAALIMVIFILPSDYIRNTVIVNLLSDRQDQALPLDGDRGFLELENNRRRGRQTLPGDNDGRRPTLRGLSEYDWQNRNRGETGEQNRQYTVKVVASKHEPVYMGDAIRGTLDPVRGFLLSQDEILNRLPSQRLFVTWKNNEPTYDYQREHFEITALSTLPQRYIPYLPVTVEPVIQSENTGLFRFIHRLESMIHPADPLALLFAPVRELDHFERLSLAPYMDLPLEDADLEIFAERLDHAMELWQERREQVMGELSNEYIERIAAILFSFSEYQYNINPSNDCSVEDMIYFLTNSKEGDCVEMSNSAALLGRIAGIPSRVVTGFLAAEGLQTPAHLRGLASLRSNIPLLQEFPFDDLYLVTDAHGHSWPQFYIPEYGWIDFESTQFAIPPTGLGDGNLRDVVIPMLDDDKVFYHVRAFPWKTVLRALVFLAILALAGAYLLRYGREAFLCFAARQGGQKGARPLYLLLLARLAADGKPVKPASKTAPEYAKLFGETDSGFFDGFAAVYTELRWRNFNDKTEEDRLFGLLKDEYKKILEGTRRKGAFALIKRIFSLRSLTYF